MERIGADFPSYHAARRPDHPALVDAAGRSLDYRAFDRRIGLRAAALRRRHGIGPAEFNALRRITTLFSDRARIIMIQG